MSRTVSIDEMADAINEAYWLIASGRELFHVVQNSTGFEMDEEYA